MEKTQMTFNQETQSHICPGLVFKSGVGGAHAGPAVSCSHPLPLAPSSCLHNPFTPTGHTPRTRKKGWSPENSGLGALTCSNTPGPSNTCPQRQATPSTCSSWEPAYLRAGQGQGQGSEGLSSGGKWRPGEALPPPAP